jgi:hypothetical protein
MSTEEDKFKKSKRLQKDENAVKKQTKIAKSAGSDISQPHRFAKHHAMDCGNPQCLLCSREKVFKEPTITQKRFDQNVEQIRDKHSNGLKNDQEDLL